MSEQVVSLLSQMLAEQVKQTQILERMAEQQLMLIQAMAEETEDPDDQPLRYMDGSLV